MINRSQSIKKRREQNQVITTDFSKIVIGAKKVEEAILDLQKEDKKSNPLYSRRDILLALRSCDKDSMDAISTYFYRTSGIYQRLCRYMAYMYRYDWVVTPYIESDAANQDTILKAFNKVLNYLDRFEVKRFFGQVALKVIKHGCYYGYIIPGDKCVAVQELPRKYCRCRWIDGQNRPLVEFNMSYFDSITRNAIEKMRILDAFPPEFKKGYIAYKNGKLTSDYGDGTGWYLLDPACAIKFNINGEDFPMFMSVIPAIVDLDQAKGLDKKKMQQKLMKILIQKLPIDKNGDLVFDPDEAQVLHNNAVMMLRNAIGIDVLTTFADVDVADTTDDNASEDDDSMDRVKQNVFDEAGVSQMQFNTDGNVALEKSILNDEASLYNLIQKFESFLNRLVSPFNKNTKKFNFRVQILPTTIYNYKEMAKMYKELTQLGYSKMLPPIALGQSQSSVLATAYFENDILDLINVFIPPLSSNVMNTDMINKAKSGGGGDSAGGRPTNQSQGKAVSEKTIQNKQSAS